MLFEIVLTNQPFHNIPKRELSSFRGPIPFSKISSIFKKWQIYMYMYKLIIMVVFISSIINPETETLRLRQSNKWIIYYLIVINWCSDRKIFIYFFIKIPIYAYYFPGFKFSEEKNHESRNRDCVWGLHAHICYSTLGYNIYTCI